MCRGGMSAIASILLAVLIGGDAAAQSTSATLSGVIVDEHRAVLREAAITLTSASIPAPCDRLLGRCRRVSSDRLAPGRAIFG